MTGFHPKLNSRSPAPQFWALILSCVAMGGCLCPSGDLSFPAHPLGNSPSPQFDVNHDGKADFSLLPDADGRLRVLAYDDNQDGTPDRIYRLDQVDPATVPHLIILFDSIPFEAVRNRYARGGLTWFHPPDKVIPPFPTMSGVIFTRMVGASPLPGVINQYFDQAAHERRNSILDRAAGHTNAWEYRLDYRLRYWENGLAFLDPRSWFHEELKRAKETFDASPDRVTVVYFASTSCMLSKYGAEGLEECLDGLEQLTVNILWERRGAVAITAMADHGHNLIHGRRFDVPSALVAAGYAPGDRIRTARDVVVEMDGLVNYAGVYTHDAPGVAKALAARPEVWLTMYQEGERIIIQKAAQTAAVERRGSSFRYLPISGDPLDYAPVTAALQSRGIADTDGFAPDQAWFEATVDLLWPDALYRAWDAFHGIAVSVPDVLLTTTPGWYAGLGSLERYIDMVSTHGGFDQTDSATFLMSTSTVGSGPVRTGNALRRADPEFNPNRLRR